MFSPVISQIKASPSLIWVVAAICFHVLNLFVGLFMTFFKKNKPTINLHKIFYATVLICLTAFLVLNQVHGENTIWEYSIGLYFITVIPLSRRWDTLLHAFLTLVGLTLLPLLIILQI